MYIMFICTGNIDVYFMIMFICEHLGLKHEQLYYTVQTQVSSVNYFFLFKRFMCKLLLYYYY